MDNGQQFTPVMPRGEIGKIAANLGCGKLQFSFGRNTKTLNDEPSVVPAVNQNQKRKQTFNANKTNETRDKGKK